MDYELKALQIKARKEVYTLLSGNNLSKLYGEGYDFAELREYQLGDDIRKINWTITAKLSKPYVKELHSNRELSIVVCSVLDGGLYFGDGNKKQKILTQIATILGYASQAEGDLFQGIAYQENSIYTTPPTKQLYHIDEYSKHIFKSSLLGKKVNKKNISKDIFKRVNRPSLIFIIGDFLEDIDLSILSQKHEVVAIIIRDRDEENPKRLGEVSLYNSYNHSKLDTYFGKRSIKNYLAKLKENDDKLIKHFSKYDIRYTKIFTDENVLTKLMQLF